MLEPYALKPFCLPIDWLQCRFAVGKQAHSRPWGNDSVITLSQGYELHRTAARSKAFARIDRVVDTRTGRSMGMLQSCPHNEQAMRANCVVLKVDNEPLYDYSWHGFLTALMDGNGWNYQATTRLDLAADGHGFRAPFADAMRGAIVPGGRSEWNVRNLPGGRGLKAVELGNRSANKFARIYGKSKELQISGKLYIADYWTENGCVDVANVERCEIQVKGRELRRYNDDERNEGDRSFLDVLTCPAARARLYHSVAAPFLRFHGGEARSRDRVDLLRWDWSEVAQGQRVTAAPRERRLRDIGLNALKSHIKLSYMFHVATGSGRYLSTAQEVAAGANLGPWMQQKAPLWKREAESFADLSSLRASGLFNMLQGCDDEAEDKERARIVQERADQKRERAALRKEHRERMKAEATARRRRA